MSDGWKEGKGKSPLDEWEGWSEHEQQEAQEIEEIDEIDEIEEAAPVEAGPSFLQRIPWPKEFPWPKEVPWSKLSWLVVALACGFVTSLLTSPQSLVAAFRSEPAKIVGADMTGGKPAEPGKVLKVQEVSSNRLGVEQVGEVAARQRVEPVREAVVGQRVAQAGDVVAQQSERLGVETVDPVPRRQQPVWQQPPVGMVVTVPASQGRLLRFDEPIESVFIADPSIADVRVVSADVVYVYGKKLGLSNLMAVSAAPADAPQNGKSTSLDNKLTATVLLRVVTDPRPAQEGLQDLSPGAADSIDIQLFGGRAVVKGKTKNVDEAVAVDAIARANSAPGQPPINTTTIDGATQVNIRVRFAEVSRNDLQSLGIDWSFQAQNGNFQFGLAKQTGGGLTSSSLNGNSSLSPNLGLSAGNSNFNLEVLIEALKRNGMLQVLAEPNLTAVTGETASFLAGGEVPIPVPQGGNSDAVTIQYKAFGVQLQFTPTMIRPNRIGLKVKPEVSSITSTGAFVSSAAGFNIPAFTVRRAETTVEVASGQTFAIAGLFQRQTSRNIEKIPLLGELPVLGQLFTSERYQRDETELVILITPYMVEPVRDDRLVTPLDRNAGAPWAGETVDVTAKGAVYDSPPPQKSKGLTKTNSSGNSGFMLK